VLSAVDTNRSRAAIQNRYPARVLSASTQDLRAEVLRCGPPGIGACLRCFNTPEPIESDDEIRARLQQLSEERLAELAKAAGVTVAEADVWRRQGRCGLPGERLLRVLRRRAAGEPAFAVSFVSVMAGTLLAAEAVKDVLGASVPLSDTLQRASVQFWRPAASTNRAAAFGRDPNCPMCVPSHPATAIWSERFTGLGPKRTATAQDHCNPQTTSP
jgi:hypothetical protein